MTEPYWMTVLKILGTSGVLIFMVRWIKEFIDTMNHNVRRKKHHESYKVLASLYGHMNGLMSDTEASRVLLLSNANGGGYPNLNNPRKSSIKHECYATDVHSIKDTWQRQELDEAYTKVLLEMLEKPNKVLWIHTDQMDSGMLKDLYVANGIKSAVIAYVFASKNEFFYLSISFKHDMSELQVDSKINNCIRAKVNAIRNLFLLDSDV